MENNKRNGEKPATNELERTLNDIQLLALRRIEGFGWKLRFVRKPLFQEPVVVVVNSEGDSIGILEQDGRINMEPDIKIRK